MLHQEFKALQDKVQEQRTRAETAETKVAVLDKKWRHQLDHSIKVVKQRDVAWEQVRVLRDLLERIGERWKEFAVISSEGQKLLDELAAALATTAPSSPAEEA